MDTYIKDNFIKLSEIKKKIESGQFNGKEKMDLINELEYILGYHPLIINAQASYYFDRGNIKKAEDTLLKGLLKYPFNFDINFNLIELYKYRNDRKNVFKYYARVIRYASNENKDILVKLVQEYVNEILSKKDSNLQNYVNDLQAFQSESDYRAFPFYKDKSSMVRKQIFTDRTNDDYFLNMYKAITKADINESERYFFKYELIKGNYVKNDIILNKQKDDIIAISPVNSKIDITFEYDGKIVKKKNLPINTFRYYNIPSDNQVKIAGNGEYFISHFVSKINKNKPKLVLYIFIDGFSYGYLKENGIMDLMPRTYTFFKDGLIADNCHFSGEWTLPSVMGIFTGKNTANHNLFHHKNNYDPELSNKFMQEYFYENGYMTAAIGDNWRSNPSYGYYKKMNRTIYSPMIERMFCDEIVFETIEHLESFKNFNNFLWLSIGDLHSVGDSLDNNPLTGVLEEDLTSDVTDEEKKSVFKNYDSNMVNHYKAQIKRTDLFLDVLYNYINKTYKQDEILVVLNSDHGQSFLYEEDNNLAYLRSNVPLMMKGAKICPKKSNEIISNVDILPTILNLCGIEANNEIDGRLMYDFGGTKREYAYMESIYPGQTYKAAVVDNTHRFYFETKEPTGNDGTVYLNEYTFRLINIETNEEESNIYQDKVDNYNKIVFEHIKQWIDI